MTWWSVALVATVTPQTGGPDPLPVWTPIRYELDTRVDFAGQRLEGTARITIRNRSSAPVATVPLTLYRLLGVTAATDGAGRPLPFRQSVVAFEDFPRLQVNFIEVRLPAVVLPADSTVVRVSYAGYLLGYSETGMLYVRDRVDTAFTMVRDDAWAYPRVEYPSFRASRGAGRRAFDYLARVTVPDGYGVANVGQLVERRTTGGGEATWTYRNLRPAWRMDFGIARYGQLEREGGAVRVFYLPGDSAGAERVADRAAAALRVLTSWFGPLRDPVPFTIVESLEGWGSQADVTGIIQAAAAFRDPSRIHEVYHEVSHLWNPTERDSLPPRWNEGLATFLEHRIAEQLDGGSEDGYARSLVTWLDGVYSRRPELTGIPMRDFGRQQQTGLSYSVGMLFFHVLDRMLGPERFNRVYGAFYHRYAPTGATTEEFAAHLRTTAGCNLDRFLADWLATTRWREALRSAGSLDALAHSYDCRPGP